MTEAEIWTGLTEIFQDVFADSSLVLSPSTTAGDIPGWDSVRMISIIVAAEEKFSVRLRAKEVDQLKSVGDLVAILSNKVND
jgi:acyl carrier protein